MKKYSWKLSYVTLWLGQAISLLTSAVLQMAIIWYLTDRTGSAMILSIATMVGFLPQALLGTVIGALVDRWNRKFVMIGADMVIAVAGITMAYISFMMELPIWVVMVVLFMRSVGTAFHSPALNAVTPLLVPEDYLIKCAGYSQSIQSVSFILGPAIAAFIYGKWNLNTAIILDVFGAVAASITVIFITIPKQEKQEDANKNFFKEIIKGYQILSEIKGLAALLWVGALFCFLYMPVNALFPLMSMNYFGGSTIHASVIETVFAAGMLLGGLILGIWGGFINRTRTMVVSLLIMGIALLVSGLLPRSGFIIFAICSGLMGLSGPFYNGVQTALIQEKVNPEYLGRVFGLMGSIMSLAMPIGLIVSGLFADIIGINNWFLLSGVGIVGLSVLCIINPGIRRMDN